MSDGEGSDQKKKPRFSNQLDPLVTLKENYAKSLVKMSTDFKINPRSMKIDQNYVKIPCEISIPIKEFKRNIPRDKPINSPKGILFQREYERNQQQLFHLMTNEEHHTQHPFVFIDDQASADVPVSEELIRSMPEDEMQIIQSDYNSEQNSNSCYSPTSQKIRSSEVAQLNISPNSFALNMIKREDCGNYLYYPENEDENEVENDQELGSHRSLHQHEPQEA